MFIYFKGYTNMNVYRCINISFSSNTSLKTVILYYTTVGTSKLTSVTVYAINLCEIAR
jgi:hypothetical protein